jgi:hypothetical protein
MVAKTEAGGVELLRMILTFLYFHIVQLVNMVKVAIALRLGAEARHGNPPIRDG